MKALHYTLLALAAVAALVGCATPGHAPSTESVDRNQDIILAEIARSRGEVEQAAGLYADAVENSRSAELVREASMYASRAGTWTEAVRLTRRWTMLEPDSEAAQWWRGMAELRAGDRANAREAFSRALQSAELADWQVLAGELVNHPRRWRAWQVVRRLARDRDGAGPHAAAARMAVAVNRLADARRHVDRAVKHAPDSERLAWLRLRIRAESGDPAALSDARMRLAADPNDAALLELANLLWVVEGAEAVVTLLAPRVTRERDRPAVAYALALAEADSGRAASARDRFTRLVRTGFRIRELWFELGRLAEEAGEHERALDFYDRIQSGEQHLKARARALLMLFELGRDGDARERMERLEARLGEQRHAFRVEAGATLSLNAHLERGEALCRRAVETRPEDGEAWFRCGLARLVASPSDRLGIEWLETARERWPGEPEILNALGYSLLEQDRSLRRAARLIDAALARSPDSGAFMDSRGWLAYKRGNYSTATQWLERAWQRTPSAEVAAHLAVARWAAGDREAARRLYREAGDRWPDAEILEKTWQRRNH